MADSNLQRSVTTATARKLATTTKTAPQMGSITPRLLLKAPSMGSGQWRYLPRQPHQGRTQEDGASEY